MQVVAVEIPNQILPMSECQMMAADVGVAPLAGVWQDADGWHVDGMTSTFGAILGPALWREKPSKDAIRIEIGVEGASDPIPSGIVGHA